MRGDWRDLPVRAAVPELLRALDGHGAAVLAAPPGTGKTTLVPLALAGLIEGRPEATRRVVVAEPRRMAARAAARRMAWLLGEEVGGRVGFSVRGERRAGPGTVVEVVTTGVLLQRLQRDPELAGVDTVLLDECHERHLDADTALAFLLDVREALRPELNLVAASATAETGPWSRLLGGAPVVEASGVPYPVEAVWAPPTAPVRPAHGMRVDPELLRHVAATVRRALREREGDVLCFLPGAGEIARTAGLLAGVDAEVLQVHGRAPAAVQDAVLGEGTGRRRVVLATSVAESSLTVPGVRIVVDGGLAREPRTDHARGLGSLTTVRVSRASAEQRAGRAGRLGPGAVYRCWSQAEHDRLPPRPSPEIAVADLAEFALQAACWGDPDASGLALLDPPPAAAMRAAREVLHGVGAVDSGGRVTERGRRLARVGAHPRLAAALVDGAEAVGARRAAEIVALLSEQAPPGAGDDLMAVWRAARTSGGWSWKEEVRRLRRSVAGEGSLTCGDEEAAGLVVALAFPERVARARESTGHQGARYLMVSGTAAEPPAGSRLATSPWLAIAVADRPASAASARIRLAVPIGESAARRAAARFLRTGEEVAWSGGDVVARQVERLGAVELVTRPLRSPARTLVRAALLDGLRAEGVGAVLTWRRDAVELRQRLAFVHRVLGAPWPDVSDAALLDRVEDWLGPELGRARRRVDLERVNVAAALARLLPWADGTARHFDAYAPERITVPTGSRIRVDYSAEQPVLAVKLQELFGWQEAPALAGGRVPLVVHLLSPAGRPAAVTADLASFWRDGYRAVRAELRGRYPKHPWPENPADAEPTRHTKAREARGARGAPRGRGGGG